MGFRPEDLVMNDVEPDLIAEPRQSLPPSIEVVLADAA